MSDNTQPTHKTTKLGILSIREIEQIVFDNLILDEKMMKKIDIPLTKMKKDIQSKSYQVYG